MADTGARLSNAPSGREMMGWVMRGEVGLALGVIGVVLLMIVPIPAFMLDVFLSISIAMSILILMTSILLKRILDFTAFPTVLLVATLYRLALNITTTRLILSHGHEGAHGAGHVIETFGKLMMGGNFIIGVIVFAILVVVNFVVITKGSGRIAEVAARFTLDSMPGKQMAIDADLSSGLIDQDEAKKRRKDLEQESTFFGAMDGASKFVRGDAVAGLVILAINVIGGILIGVIQHKVPIGQAFSTYTIMSIGDGLVSQIPALIISIAAGFLVSKAGVEGAADKALVTQLATNPVSLGMVAAAAGGLAIIPGMPILPFAALSIGAGVLAWRRSHAKPVAEAVDIAPVSAEESEEPISQTLAIDEIKIELGYGLLPLINDLEGRRLTDQIKALRRTLATDFGFVMPSVRILDNMRLPSQGYCLRIKEMEAGSGEVRIGQLMAMDPRGAQVELPGEHMKEPAFGLPATWIDDGLREEATFRGYTIVDPATVLTTHLTEVLKENMPDLADLRRGPEADQGPARGAEEAGRRPDPQRRHRDDGAARVAGPVARADLDPRPRRHPGGDRRGGAAHQLHHPAGRTGAWAPGPPALLRLPRRRRRPADRHPVGGLGERLRGRPGGLGRREAAGAGPVTPAGIHPRHPRNLRTGRARRRSAGAPDQPDHPALRPLDHRTVPGPDAGHEPERNPPARAPQDRRGDLTPLQAAPAADSGSGLTGASPGP